MKTMSVVDCTTGANTEAVVIDSKPLVARRETDGTVIIVAKNVATGKHERVEVPQEHIKHVRRYLKRFTLPGR
jgi:hypothetical protein